MAVTVSKSLKKSSHASGQIALPAILIRGRADLIFSWADCFNEVVKGATITYTPLFFLKNMPYPALF